MFKADGRSFREEIQDYLRSCEADAITEEQTQPQGGQLEASFSEDVPPHDVRHEDEQALDINMPNLNSIEATRHAGSTQAAMYGVALDWGG